MKICLIHNWDIDGFEEMGAYTKRWYKCKKCDSYTSTYTDKPANATLGLLLLAFLPIWGLFALLCYLYVNL